MAKQKIRHGFRYFRSRETRLDPRYPVWMEGRTVNTDNGMITKQKLMKFLSSIHKPVPEDALPDIIVIEE